MYDQLNEPEQFEGELIYRSNEPYDPYIPSGSNAGVGPSGQPQGQSNQKVRASVHTVELRLILFLLFPFQTLYHYYLEYTFRIAMIDPKHPSPN